MLKKGGWYEHCIDEPILDLVKTLRDHGYNTECSCGHEMYVQCDLNLDGELKRLHDLLFCYLAERKEPINYVIKAVVRVVDGCQYNYIDVYFPHKGKETEFALRVGKEF